jgi:hypothetical protein
MNSTKFDGVVKNPIWTVLQKVSPMVPPGNALGVLSRKFHIPPLKISGIKKEQRFFSDEAIHVVCRVSEKPLQRSKWDFLRRHQSYLSYIYAKTVKNIFR